MKKWYCPHCDRFKQISKVYAGVMGYPDTYHCRCCGTELVRVSWFVEKKVKEMIRDEFKKGDEKH